MSAGNELFATPEGNYRFRLNAEMIEILKSDVVVLTQAPFPGACGKADLPLLTANDRWHQLFDKIVNNRERCPNKRRLERLVIGHAVELQLDGNTFTLPWPFRANVNSELELGFQASELGYYLYQGNLYQGNGSD